MSKPRARWSAFGFFALIALFATVFVAAATGGERNGAEEAKAKAPRIVGGSYIVLLAEEPVVAYEGGIEGVRATAPR